MQNSYTKIPVPASTKWREFRINIVPILLFICAIIVVALLWSERVQRPDFIGKVSASTAVITAPADGYLKDFSIEDFQYVEQGQQLAILTRAVDGELEARKKLIEQEIKYIRQSLSPAQTSYRAFLDFKSMNFELLDRRLELAELRSDSVFIDLEYSRVKRLFESGLSDRQEFERVESRREMNQIRIEEMRNMIETMQPEIERLEAYSPISSADFRASVDAAVSVQHSQLELTELMYGDIFLTAPLSGKVRKRDTHLSGYVSKGDTLAVVEAAVPEYIIGYVRQPFSVRPEPGMEVEIRSRGMGKARYHAVINEVGAQIQPIMPDLQRPGMSQESGLPVKVSIEADFYDVFVPGEIVDLILL